MTIHGNGATITRTTTGDAFEVIAGTTVAENLLFATAPVSIRAGANLTLADSNLTASPVSASGSLSITTATISASTITSTGTTNIAQSSISGTSCLATSGNLGSITVRQSLIRACQGTMTATTAARLTFESSTITESGSTTVAAISANSSGRVNIHSSTITENNGKPFTVGTNTSPNGPATVTVTNSIVAYQRNGNPDCASPITSGGFNLISAPSCAGAAATDLLGADPQLGSLSDNGGPTLTYLPAATSPSVDSGDAALCPTVDQRGLPRPSGAGCDRGAVER
jgi:hypothetical protein